MMAELVEYVLTRGPYLAVVAVAVVGMYLMVSHSNVLKAVAGLYLFQTSAILFFISVSFRAGATVPILEGEATVHNPLPHAMMLTAIVVGVATLGVAMAILRRIQYEHGSLEAPRGPEDEP